jgi:hypothetical protein
MHPITLPAAPPIDSPEHWYSLIRDIRMFLARADRRATNRDNVNRLIDEYTSGVGVTQITVNPQITNPILVSSIIAVSSAGTATLTAGMRSIPLLQGVTVMNGLTMQLRGKEYPLTLTGSVSGNLFLEIMAEEWAVATQ